MKKLWLLIILLPTLNFAQSKRQQYILQYKDVAIREMKLYGIPASITLAQGILESGDGQSKLAQKANNHFGIKCHSDWKGGKAYHDDDRKNECFRKYKHAEESYRDHSLFLAERSRYAELFTLDRMDYKAWAKGLKKAGYATSSTYASALINLIETNNLQQYDLAALGETILPEERILITANGAKYVVLNEGESIESIAQLYNKGVDRLLDFNDLTFESKISADQRIFLRHKKAKGATKYYKVQAGETMHDISQEQGIKLEQLYRRNRKPVGWQPKAGESIRLRGRVKK